MQCITHSYFSFSTVLGRKSTAPWTILKSSVNDAHQSREAPPQANNPHCRGERSKSRTRATRLLLLLHNGEANRKSARIRQLRFSAPQAAYTAANLAGAKLANDACEALMRLPNRHQNG
jgi:hypothetical protein